MRAGGCFNRAEEGIGVRGVRRRCGLGNRRGRELGARAGGAGGGEGERAREIGHSKLSELEAGSKRQ